MTEPRKYDTILLCSFVPNNPYAITKAKRVIRETAVDGSGYIFVLENLDNKEQVLMVYNTKKQEKRPRSTIQVSRNKATNTIYTIAALNEITKEEDQNNVTDKGHVKVTWEKYQNMLLITSKDEKGNPKLNKYKTKLLEVIDMD